jgi:hypothetical protein
MLLLMLSQHNSFQNEDEARVSFKENMPFKHQTMSEEFHWMFGSVRAREAYGLVVAKKYTTITNKQSR